MSKKISNVEAAHKWAVKWAKKREDIERYGETLPKRMNDLIDEFSDPDNLPRSVRGYVLDAMHSAAKSFGQQNRQIQSGTDVYNAFGYDYKINPVRLPYRKKESGKNANELNKSIEDVVNKAVDNTAYNSSYVGVYMNANLQLSELLKTPGVEYVGDADKPLSWSENGNVTPDKVDINVTITKLDVNVPETREALKRFHSKVPYANPKLLKVFKREYLERSYNTHVSKLASIKGIDADLLYSLESIMNTSAAWQYAKRADYDSEQMVDEWRTMYMNLLSTEDSSIINDLKTVIKLNKGNPDIDISNDFADIIENRLMAAMKGA